MLAVLTPDSRQIEERKNWKNIVWGGRRPMLCCGAIESYFCMDRDKTKRLAFGVQ